MDAGDYAILARLTAPDQPCSISIDILEPIAIQLSQFIDQCLLDDQGAWTSDSGTVSDYDSSACDIADSVKSDSFSISRKSDHNVLVKRAEDTEYEKKEEVMPIPESNNTSSLEEVSAPVSLQVKNVDSDSQSTTAEDEADILGNLLHKVKDRDATSDTGSVSLLQDQEVERIKLSQNEAIMVADLEKSFFSSKTEYIMQPEKNAAHGQYEDQKVYLNIRRRKSGLILPRTTDYGSRRTHEFSRRGHFLCRGRDKGRKQRSVSYSGSENTYYRSTCYSHKRSNNYYQPSSTTETRHPRHNRGEHGLDQGRDNCSREYFPEPRQLQSEPRNESTYKKKRSNRNINEKNEVDGAGSQCNGRKQTKLDFYAAEHHHQEQLHQQQQPQPQPQPSPLVLHSQNMWSANLDIVKSARKYTTGYHQHHMHWDKDNAFNHYEVGCFLLEGKHMIVCYQ